jgi:hypothetical protein
VWCVVCGVWCVMCGGGRHPSQYRFDLLDNVLMDPDISSHTPMSRLLAVAEAAANLDALATGNPLQNVVRNSSCK